MPEKPRILIIDDEEAFCEFVKLSLEKTGNFEVVVSTNGPDGLGRAASEKPALILLDIRMPQMNGTEVADQLLHNDDTRDIPIAFITGLLQKEDVEKRAGYIHGFPFITKPVTREELIRQVNALFQLIKAQQSFLHSIDR
jgi:CheY-like chemotaxis protein